jgi:hypothetical protein
MTTHLLAIGVNATPGGSTLRFAESDAVKITRALTSSRGSTVPENALLLRGAQATKATVLGQLGALARSSATNVILYFCGHGNEHGIALADGLLTYDELQPWIRAIRARTKTAVFDACHAGASARIFQDRIAGLAGVELERSWAEALAQACPGLRIFAAVGAAQLAHEDLAIRGSRFTAAFLQGLRCSRGDIRAGDRLFISDAQAFRVAKTLVSEWWPDEPRPQLLGPVGALGTLPLMLSQAEAPVGAAVVHCFLPGEGTSAHATIDAYDRRFVVTHLHWSVEDLQGVLLGRGCECIEFPSARARVTHTIHLPPSVLLDHAHLGVHLRRGGVVPVRWRLSVQDDHHHVLDRSTFSHQYVLTPHAA